MNTTKHRLASGILLVFMSAGHLGHAAAPGTMVLTSEGWTVEARDGGLAIRHERLGTVLEELRLNIATDGDLCDIGKWSAEITGPKAHQASSRHGGAQKEWTPESGTPGQLILRTAQPASTWVFEPVRECLKISCTAPGAVLTGRVPVPDGRTLARLLDKDGVPVTWQGTGECAGTYGGGFTRNASFLPRENPDCMYFALGQASGSLFHCLFDRETDTAVRFPEQTRFVAGSGDDRLDLTMPLPGPGQIRVVPDYYTKVLGLPRYVPQDLATFDRAPMGWCSWTSYFADVTEGDIVRNTDWLAEHLKPYGFQYVVIDDGYDRIPGRFGPQGHHWLEPWHKENFPKGPKWIAGYIKSRGLRPGLWLVPNAYADAVKTHPDWYLRDRDGGFIRVYNTPALDSSHPGTMEFLGELFGRLGEWGFEYYKFDGEFAVAEYAPKVDRSRFHDRTTDPLEIYQRRLAMIRKAVGPGIFIEGCPSGTPLDGIGHFNSYFNGQDVYNNWQGMHALFDSINANAFLNRMVVYVMPGEGLELGERMSVEDAQRKRAPNVVANASQREDPMIGLGVTQAEARTLVSVVALTGVAYPLSGVMPELPMDRLPLLQRTLPTMPIAPMDLFSRGSDADWACFRSVRADDYIHHYPEVIDLKVAAESGIYDVVALPNWRSAPVTKSVSLAGQLGLEADAKYIAFDFWNQALLGVVSGRLDVEVAGHDTRVVLLHRLLDRPQLVGTSRHITGAHSIKSLAWNAADKALHGISEVVPGEAYTLFIHLPEGAAPNSPPSASAGGEPVTVRQQMKDGLLSLGFNTQMPLVEWQIGF